MNIIPILEEMVDLDKDRADSFNELKREEITVNEFKERLTNIVHRSKELQRQAGGFYIGADRMIINCTRTFKAGVGLEEE